jgi:hypothetical protein
MQVCGDIPFRIDRWMICFTRGHQDEFDLIFTKGYHVHYDDYRDFAGKNIAHKVITQQDRLAEIDSVIQTLEPLENPAPSLFAISTPTPPAEQVHNVQVSDEDFRKLVTSPIDVAWPAVTDGMPKGGCAVFISADRTGTVREAFYAGCDNANLQEPLRLAALKWKLHPAEQNGVPAQVTALVGIPFEIHVDTSHNVVLSEADARKLATNTVEPTFPPGTKPGTVATVLIHIDDDGRFLEAVPGNEESTNLFLAAYNAVSKWKFTPYTEDGKSVDFRSTITFTAP